MQVQALKQLSVKKRAYNTKHFAREWNRVKQKQAKKERKNTEWSIRKSHYGFLFFGLYLTFFLCVYVLTVLFFLWNSPAFFVIISNSIY